MLHKSKNPRFKTGYQWIPRLVIASNSLQTLEYIRTQIQVGRIHEVHKSRHLGHYQIHFQSAQLRQILLPPMLPYFVTKHDEATLLFKACDILANRTRSSPLTEIALSNLCDAMKLTRERNLHV